MSSKTFLYALLISKEALDVFDTESTESTDLWKDASPCNLSYSTDEHLDGKDLRAATQQRNYFTLFLHVESGLLLKVQVYMMNFMIDRNFIWTIIIYILNDLLHFHAEPQLSA